MSRRKHPPKGIIPELQARLAKRREYIAGLEDDLIVLNASKAHYEVRKAIRNVIVEHAKEQKLDKDILVALCAARTFFTNRLEKVKG